MIVKEIKNPLNDDGATTVKLYTKLGTYEGLFRVFNKPEMFTWYKVQGNNNLPSPIVETTGQPSAKQIESLLKNGIMVKYFPDSKFPYYIDHVKASISFQLDRAYPIISLPDYSESNVKFDDKIDVIRKLKAEHQNNEKCQMMPYIRSDHKTMNFQKRLGSILNKGYNMLGIDIHGNNTKNLAFLKEVLNKWETDVWVHASNVPKKFDNVSKASYPHILSYYHIHSYANRIGTFYRGDGKSEDVEHFDSQSLGIIPYKDLSFTFGTSCNCKYHRDSKYYTDDRDEMFVKSRIHDMVDGQTELQRATISIKEQNFERYLKSKKCANTALFS
jgi:hypothetical protein